jgi:hypothetical protein
MTKVRAPASIGTALSAISVQLGGYDATASVVDRNRATVYRWGDPDGSESIPLDSAIKLDIAYRLAGGEGAPILAAYKAQLAIAEADALADRDCLAMLAMRAVKEAAEATQAHIACTQPGATDLDWQTAIRETEESIVAHQNALVVLKRGAGPIEGERDPPGEGTGK